ncbi:MAG: hypothetical protein IJ733_11575, partial [Lachnospiraceae bacterium]|nr:hypothetical protein [Lachnospiraceae bacterium]
RFLRRGAKRLTAVAAVLVAVLLIGSGVYAANRIFNLDFFASRYDGGGLKEETKKFIKEKPEVTIKKSKESEGILDYEVSEVLCDSRALVATVNISLKEPEKYFLFTGTDDIKTPLAILNIGTDSMETIAQYSEKHGLKPVLADLLFDKRTEEILDRCTTTAKYDDSGKLTVMFTAERKTKDKEFIMGIRPIVVNYDGEKMTSQYYDDTLEVHVKDQTKEISTFYQVTKEGEEILSKKGISVERIELKTTEVGSYLQVEYQTEKEIDREKDFPPIFCFGDEKGKKMYEENPLQALSDITELGNNRYQSEISYEKITSPDEICLMTNDLEYNEDKNLVGIKIKRAD